MPTLLITGANRGIGLEFTRQYLAEGWHIIATCRNPDTADALHGLREPYPNLRIEKLDVADPAAINTLAERLNDTAIDLLINNAGIISGGHTTQARHADPTQTFGTIDAASWAQVFRINSISPILIMQAFTPHLKRGSHKKIINITSKMGSLGDMAAHNSGGHIAYRSSKAALNAAVLAVTPDLRQNNIMVVNFHPGWVKTDMGSDAAPLLPRDSVNDMRHMIERLSLKDTGSFYGYDGSVIAW